MSLWFTSDTHFGHRNILKYEAEARPFSDTSHMDEVLIANWNASVQPDDTVIHLGDVLMGDFEAGLRVLSRLNGRKFLVPGNHDRVFSGESQSRQDRFRPAYAEHFEILREVTHVFVGGRLVILSHFPYAGDHAEVDRYPDKRPFNEGHPLVHGHVHSLWHTKDNMFNAGVDVNGLAPVHEDVIASWVDSL